MKKVPLRPVGRTVQAVGDVNLADIEKLFAKTFRKGKRTSNRWVASIRLAWMLNK